MTATFILSLTLLASQTPAPAAGAAGLPPPWAAKRTIEELRAQVNHVNEALGRLDVAGWQGTGAENYVAVAEAARRQMSGIAAALEKMAAQPQKLGAAMHLFLALQQVTATLDSITRGAQQFRGADGAREIEESTNAMIRQREEFTRYVLELVGYLENSVAVSQRELESCREQLFKRAAEPARPPARRR